MNNSAHNVAPSPVAPETGGADDPVRRLRLRVHGAVQGVGYRPTVYRIATSLGLAGWVANDPAGVTVEVEGPAEAVEAFRRRLEAEAPPLAAVHEILEEWQEPLREDGDGRSFVIRRSDSAGEKTAVVLPDAATCPACLAEVLDPDDRRHRYPFTNCTHCGPRFTIVRALPYDRPNTTMAGFTMCPACRREYEDPLDRRFHAQPNACPDCGPVLELLESDGTLRTLGDDALAHAADDLRRGRIVALEGLGGFQLLADARNGVAVATLRRRKSREEKPFALMVRDLRMARKLTEVPEEAAEVLSSVHAPIVLLRRRRAVPTALRPAESVAPGNPWLGLMLPTTPLHHLLLRDVGFPVVATSGNLSDEPIATDPDDAVERLAGIADSFLVHDRPIARHADDSVVQVVDTGRGERTVQILRRARGYAPMPVFLPARHEDTEEGEGDRERPGPATSNKSSTETEGGRGRPLPPSEGGRGTGSRGVIQSSAGSRGVIALGAHLKNTVALATGTKAYLSQHLGDMETPRALDAFERVVADFLDLYGAKPHAVAHDLHPDYATTRAAHRLAAELEERLGRPVERVAVQHHHAHLAACLADAGRPLVGGTPVLGVTWDGTGYGMDGTVWGGEFLLGDAASFRRVGRLRPFRLPGGEAAVREPRRVALALLWELLGPEALERDDLAPVASFAPGERRLLGRLLETGANAPLTTSAGRLFDGVAALAGLRQTVSFEGQAAMELEWAASDLRQGGGPETYPLPLGSLPEEGDGPVFELDWQPLVAAVVDDVEAGSGPHTVSRRFHAALAGAVVDAARRVAEEEGEVPVALTGGCFQNRRLTAATTEALGAAGFEVLLHSRVPANDGGIAFGQAAVAAARLGLEADGTTARSRPDKIRSGPEKTPGEPEKERASCV